jgi:hypothetical protein
MYPRHLGYLIPDGEYRVQRRHWLLKDHGDAVPPHFPDLLVSDLDEILSLELDVAPGLDSAGGLDQPENRQRGY